MAPAKSKAARLNARVRFERKGARGNVGGVVRSAWTAMFGPVWGELKPIRGGEQALADRIQGLERFELTVRGCHDVRRLTTDDRVVDHHDPARTFGILNILNPDMRGVDYVLLLERGKANG